VIRNKLSSKHIDPCTLNCFVDGELHVDEDERVWQHLTYCRLCALDVVSSIELKAAVARAGLRLAPCAVGTAKANSVRKGDLVYIDSQPALRTAVNQLQPTLRQALLLCDVEELSYRDIAIILNIPVRTVISRISDARDTLCQLLIPQHRKSQ
jgi:DNA-directed RNA polymerase specialized sigma24 family protein